MLLGLFVCVCGVGVGGGGGGGGVCVCVCVLIVYCWYTTDKGDYPEKCKSFVLINGVLLNLLCVWIWYTIGSGVFRVCCVFWLVLAEDERLSDNTLPLH